MFDALTERLTAVFSQLKGKGKLSEADVNAGLREIRLALLEADVHYKVVKDLIASVREKAIGQRVIDSLTPGQQMVKIVRDELRTLMGQSRAALDLSHRPAVIALVGLQGSGKTTTAAKLALTLRKDGRKPLLVAADIVRPAAIDQLETLGKALDLPVFSVRDGTLQPPAIAAAGLAEAKAKLCDVMIIDTAGRLQIDEQMMSELEQIKRLVPPDEILLVADAMTGQEAVNVARSFDERVELTGVVLTKLDGDARGGAALSIRAVTGCPIKYAGLGEKITPLEAFHPERMADRILGMGDVLTLIEQAEEHLDREKSEAFAKRIRENRFTLQDFLEQMEEMRKLGPIGQILEKLPGAAKLKLKGDAAASAGLDERDLDRTLAILRAMTLEERAAPSIIGGSRKKRIARGSGTQVRDVNRVLARYDEAKRALKLMGKRRVKGRSPLDFAGLGM